MGVNFSERKSYLFSVFYRSAHATLLKVFVSATLADRSLSLGISFGGIGAVVTSVTHDESS